MELSDSELISSLLPEFAERTLILLESFQKDVILWADSNDILAHKNIRRFFHGLKGDFGLAEINDFAACFEYLEVKFIDNALTPANLLELASLLTTKLFEIKEGRMPQLQIQEVNLILGIVD
jgi:chemotaxis protein histidine kinase CheA